MAHAIRLHETGGPEVLRYEQVEAGEPGCTVRGSAETWSARESWSASHHG